MDHRKLTLYDDDVVDDDDNMIIKIMIFLSI